MKLTCFVILLGMFDSSFAVTPKECSQPKRIENAAPRLSASNNRYPHNSFVPYHCDSGYVGILRYMCVNGEWIKSNPEHTCSLKRCGTPKDILHGTFKLTQGEDLVFGARIEYKCDEGYRLVGTRNYMNCELSGWTGLVPYCEVRTCPPVNNPENGRIAEPSFLDNAHDYPFGSFLRFECNSPNMEIHGARQIYCLENGTWSNPVPKCKELKCKRPDIPNANVKTENEEFRYLENLSYTCNRNFKPSGLRSTTCTESGWSPPPLCTPIICSRPPIENGYFETTKWIFSHKETVEFVCNRNYKPLVSNEVRCEEQGLTPSPSCVEIRCYIEIDAAIYPNSWAKRVGDWIRYSCRVDRSSHNSRCTEHGWEPPLKCTGPCSRPDIPNMIPPRSYSYRDGETLSIECAYGYRLQGVKVITCRDGQWFIGRSYPTCIEQGCATPPNIENGEFTPHRRNYAERESVTYSCKKGFELFGKSHLQCISNRWPQEPTCVDVENVCPDSYPLIEHGDIGFVEQYKIIYTCRAGYIMDGSDVVMCLNGNWSDPPTCNAPPDPDQDCDLPPQVENGDTIEITSPPYRHGRKVTYQCQNFYVLEGKREVTCSGGKWTKPPHCLAPCILTKEDFTNKGVALKWKFETRIDVKDGDVLEFSCREGYEIEPPARRYCRNGHLEIPRCISDVRNECSHLEYFACQSCRNDEICTEYNSKRVSITRPDLSTVLLDGHGKKSNALFSVKTTRATRKTTLKFFIKESKNAKMEVIFGTEPQSILYEQPAVGEYCFPFTRTNTITFNVTFSGNFRIRFDKKKSI
ncbi:complement factor H-like [Mobula hypostoma]|uniref:complement factor H-like n=1 Tax=Mobula hypostoma TaxID=723540 RepID=UPI002FC28B77